MAVSETHRIEKRDRITEAAISVFAQKGYRASRVADVAREAGVADGTIYLYFRSKEELLLTIFEEKMEDLLSELSEALSGIASPLEQVRVFAEQHFRQLQNNPDLAQVFQIELRQSHRFIREYRPEKLWQYLDVFAEVIERGKRAGVVRQDVDPFIAKWAFFGALDELSIQWVLARKRDRFDLETAATQIVEMFLCGIKSPEPKE
jgi:TetR/AcrR family fatty acid metabolism transcriptional regulator